MRQADPDNPQHAQLRELVDQLSILLAASRALLRSAGAKATLLDGYDCASEEILRTLGRSGLAPADLMVLERHLARLRLALNDAAPKK